MEHLDKNILIQLALELQLPHLINLCRTNKRANQVVCNNNVFWMNKLYKDYPETKGNLPRKSDYQKIYRSLYKRERYYYDVFKSQCDKENQPPKFWPFIKKRKFGSYWNSITEFDYEFAEKMYPDFVDRCGEEENFVLYGDWPNGTQLWLAYCDDLDVNLNMAFISREQAINKIIEILGYFLRDFYIDREEVESFSHKTIEEIYGYKNQHEILESFRKQLLDKGYLRFYDMQKGDFYWYIIQDFIIVDYTKMLEELKKKNPDWNKLPKDMIQYILKYLQ